PRGEFGEGGRRRPVPAARARHRPLRASRRDKVQDGEHHESARAPRAGVPGAEDATCDRHRKPPFESRILASGNAPVFGAGGAAGPPHPPSPPPLEDVKTEPPGALTKAASAARMEPARGGGTP